MRIDDLATLPELQTSERQKAKIYGDFISRVEWLLRREALREGSHSSPSRPDFDLGRLSVAQIAIVSGDHRPSASLWRIASQHGVEAYVKASGYDGDVYVTASGSVGRRLAAVPFGPRDLADMGLGMVRGCDFAFGALLPEGTVLAPGLVDTNALQVGSKAPFVELALVPLEPAQSPGGIARGEPSGRLIAYTAADAERHRGLFEDSLRETAGLHTVFARIFDGSEQRILTARMPSVRGEDWFVLVKEGSQPERTSERMDGMAMKARMTAFLTQANLATDIMPRTARDLLEEPAPDHAASPGR